MITIKTGLSKTELKKQISKLVKFHKTMGTYWIEFVGFKFKFESGFDKACSWGRSCESIYGTFWYLEACEVRRNVIENLVDEILRNEGRK